MQGEAVAGKRFSVVAEYALRVLGLDYIADTFVGGPMLRGISGGQKKRLTTGEMLVGCAVQDNNQATSLVAPVIQTLHGVQRVV